MGSNENIGSSAAQQVRQRRVLFAALSPFMKRDALYAALWGWEELNAGRPAAPLHKYVATLCASSALAARRSEVNRGLIEAMQLPESALGPDPMSEMLAFRRRINGTAGTDVPDRGQSPSTLPANSVLAVIVKGLGDRLERHNPPVYPSYLRYVMENLFMLRLPVAAEGELAALLRRATDRLTHSYTPETMQSLLHLLYVGACEYFGPVKSDELLAAAVAEAERLPAARLFPPRRLL